MKLSYDKASTFMCNAQIKIISIYKMIWKQTSFRYFYIHVVLIVIYHTI